MLDESTPTSIPSFEVYRNRFRIRRSAGAAAEPPPPPPPPSCPAATPAPMPPLMPPRWTTSCARSAWARCAPALRWSPAVGRCCCCYCCCGGCCCCCCDLRWVGGLLLAGCLFLAASNWLLLLLPVAAPACTPSALARGPPLPPSPLSPAGHCFCSACLSNHFASQLGSGQPLSCPLR